MNTQPLPNERSNATIQVTSQKQMIDAFHQPTTTRTHIKVSRNNFTSNQIILR